ncbi:MAG TPA: hypothetical protein VGF45_18445, partial [Polyangia bacterium]
MTAGATYARADQSAAPATLVASAASGRGANAATGAVSYERDIKPILVRHCYECHGEGGSRGEVALDRHASLEHLRQ